MTLPEEYAERITQDARAARAGELLPEQNHVELRKYVLETGEKVRDTKPEDVREEWRKRRIESKKIARECQKRTEEIRESLPKGVKKMWGKTNLGFLSTEDPMGGLVK